MSEEITNQNPFAELTREQLIAQLTGLSQQLSTFANLRVNGTRKTVGEVIDGLNFLLQAAQAGDPQAVGECRMIKSHLEQILKGQWTPLRQVLIPR